MGGVIIGWQRKGVKVSRYLIYRSYPIEGFFNRFLPLEIINFSY